MVYCQKCGTLNTDSAVNCSNCGTPLFVFENRPYYSRRAYRRRYANEYRYRGNGFGLLLAGIIIVFVGLAAFFGYMDLFWQYFWPAILVLIGVWLLLWGLKRYRRYNHPTHS